MAMNDKRGYRSGLVDLRLGRSAARSSSTSDIYAEEQEQHLRPRLAASSVTKARSPSPATISCRRMGEESVILCRDRAERDPRLPQFLPPSRHEGVPLRRGQHGRLHLPLSRLELRHRRAAGRRAVFPRGLPFAARPRAMGPRRGRAAAQLQGHDLGDLGSGGAALPRISRRLHALPRPAARRLGRPRGRQAEVLGGVQKWLHAVQLEIPGREFQRRHLSQHQPPLGRPGRHRPVGQPAAATWASAT